MTQTLNFAVNVDQSQIPAVFQQVQSGIASQLQAGSMQLGNMTANVQNMITGMAASGSNPAAMSMAYSTASGAVNHTLGKAPFLDRYSMMTDFSNKAYGAVLNRASSIIAPAERFGPEMPSYGRKMTNAVFGGAIDAASIFAQSKLALAAYPKGGWVGSSLAFAGSSALLAPFAKRAKSFVSHMTGMEGYPDLSTNEGQKAYQDKLGQRVAARDLGAIQQALAPQKYATTRFGEQLSQEQLYKRGEYLQSVFYGMAKKTNDIHLLKMGHAGTYAARGLQHMAMANPKIQRLLTSGAAGVTRGPEDTSEWIRENAHEGRLAALYGASTVSDPRYDTMNRFLKYGGMKPKYSGPNRWQLMGRAMGFATGLGRGFGEEVMNKSIRFDATRDLGMSREQREAQGGAYGIGAAYGGMIMQQAATFGSPTSLLYAAIQNAGAVPERITDIASMAAGTFADPNKFFRYKLDYKDIVTRGGGRTAVAAHKHMVGLKAKMLMENYPGGGIKNMYEARRLIYESEGRSPEQSASFAANDESVGMTIKTIGSGKESLADLYGEEAAMGSLAHMEFKGHKLEEEQKRTFAHIKGIDRTTMPDAHNIGAVTTGVILRAAKDYGSYEEAIRATTDPNVKSQLQLMQRQKIEWKTLGDQKTPQDLHSLQMTAGINRNFEVNADEFLTTTEVGKIQKFWKIDTDKRREIMNHMVKGELKEATDLANRNGITSRELNILAPKIKSADDVERAEHSFAAHSRMGKKGTYLPGASEQFGVYDEQKNRDEQVRLLLALVNLIKSNPAVRKKGE